MPRNTSVLTPFTGNQRPKWVERAIAVILIINVTLLVLGAVAWSRAQFLNLPISSVLPGLAVFLPILNAVGLSHGIAKSKGNRQALKSIRVSLNIVLLTIADVILVTISATHLPPSESSCRLHSGWQTMFSDKDAKHLKRIQDALNCCGFKKGLDRPYPFPDKGHQNGQCLGTQVPGCERLWTQEDKMVAALCVVVGSVLGLMKFSGWIAVNHDELPRKTMSARDSEALPDPRQRFIEEYHDEDEEAQEGGEENGHPRALREPDEHTGLLLPQNNSVQAGTNPWHA